MGFSGQATSKGSDGEQYPLAPAGNHVAVLVGLVDLGTRREPGFQGAPEEDVHKVLFVWELCGQNVPNTSNPFTMPQEFRFSQHKKAGMVKMLESWRGASYPEGAEIDPEKCLGRACLLNVGHKANKDNTRTYANILGVTPVPPGLGKPAPRYQPFSWQFGDINLLPAWLPPIFGDSVRERVQASNEWRARYAGPGQVPQVPHPMAATSWPPQGPQGTMPPHQPAASPPPAPPPVQQPLYQPPPPAAQPVDEIPF